MYIVLRIRIAAYRADDQSSTHLSESCEFSTLELPAVSRWSRDPSEHCLQKCSPMYGVLLEPTVDVCVVQSASPCEQDIQYIMYVPLQYPSSTESINQYMSIKTCVTGNAPTSQNDVALLRDLSLNHQCVYPCVIASQWQWNPTSV